MCLTLISFINYIHIKVALSSKIITWHFLNDFLSTIFQIAERNVNQKKERKHSWNFYLTHSDFFALLSACFNLLHRCSYHIIYNSNNNTINNNDNNDNDRSWNEYGPLKFFSETHLEERNNRFIVDGWNCTSLSFFTWL